MCGHDSSKGPGTWREKNIRGDSQALHGTSIHTSFLKSLTTPLNLPHTLSHTHGAVPTHTHTHTYCISPLPVFKGGLRRLVWITSPLIRT